MIETTAQQQVTQPKRAPDKEKKSFISPAAVDSATMMGKKICKFNRIEMCLTMTRCYLYLKTILKPNFGNDKKCRDKKQKFNRER
jgi:hypothetical protein